MRFLEKKQIKIFLLTLRTSKITSDFFATMYIVHRALEKSQKCLEINGNGIERKSEVVKTTSRTTFALKPAHAVFILAGHNSLHHFSRVYYTPGRLVQSRPLPNLMPVFSLRYRNTHWTEPWAPKIKSGREITENVPANESYRSCFNVSFLEEEKEEI